jgi:hypothetical protein
MHTFELFQKHAKPRNSIYLLFIIFFKFQDLDFSEKIQLAISKSNTMKMNLYTAGHIAILILSNVKAGILQILFTVLGLMSTWQLEIMK